MLFLSVSTPVLFIYHVHCIVLNSNELKIKNENCISIFWLFVDGKCRATTCSFIWIEDWCCQLQVNHSNSLPLTMKFSVHSMQPCYGIANEMLIWGHCILGTCNEWHLKIIWTSATFSILNIINYWIKYVWFDLLKYPHAYITL